MCFFSLWAAGNIHSQGRSGGDPTDQSFSWGETLLALLSLLGIVLLVLLSWKISSFLRGGELSSAWLLIFFSFVLLAIVQLLLLGNLVGVFNIAQALIFSAKLLSILSLLAGIFFIKKILS